MLKKEITYVDFNGVTQTETHYFHLNRIEAVAFQEAHGGDLEEYARSVKDAAERGETNLTSSSFKFIEDLILAAYGERSADGRAFVKSRNGQKLADEFSESLAFAQLFEDLLTVEGEAQAFATAMVAQPGQQTDAPAQQPALQAVPDAPKAPTSEELLKRLQNDPVLMAQLLQDAKK